MKKKCKFENVRNPITIYDKHDSVAFNLTFLFIYINTCNIALDHYL